jgi:hypothetical protein
MDKVTKIDKKYLIIAFIIIILALTLATFWRSLDFYFWRDDWDLWSQQYYFWKILPVHNHPGTWVSRALLYHVFGWNRLAWQSLGLVLRIVTSLVVSLLILEISKSKKTAILAGIFYATSILGMETVTWASVYIIPEIIILNCLGFYTWVLFVERRSLKLAAISILLFALAVLGDPGRTIFIVPLIVLWEISNWWISSKKETLIRLFVRVGLFTISFVLFMRFFLLAFYGARVSLWDNIKYIVSDLESFTSLFNSIGNLLLGWLKSPGGGDSNQLALPIIIILSLVGFVLGFLKKSRFGMVLLLLTLWIPVMYIPNWLSNKFFAAPPTDHYLAVSAVGYLGILALLVSAISVRWLMYLVALSFILFNIKTANEVLISESSFRSYKIVEPYFDQIEREVPKGEKNSIFMYLGNDNAKYLDLDWSGSVPFGIKRKLTKYEDFPIATSDDKLILKLLCEDNVYRPSMFDWIYQEKRIQLSHLHAWELNGGVLKNVSIEKREKFRKDARLKNCIVEE